MKIRMIVSERTFTGCLDSNETAKDFAALLPIELQFSDYNTIEKVADLPERLSNKGAQEGYEPKAGDIAYYAPWGNLALFYHNFGYSRGLIRLGRIETGLEELSKIGSTKARIERIE